MEPSLYQMPSGFECCPVTWPPGEQHQLNVFWYPAGESYLISPDPAIMSLQQKVKAFLVHLFGKFKYWGMTNLVQFWTPFTTNTGGMELRVWDQPFAVGQLLCSDVCKYRLDSILSILDEGHTVKLAFSTGVPSLHYGIPSSWAFPLFEQSSSRFPVGVLEFVSSRDCFEIFQYCSVSQLYEQFCEGHFFYESGGHITGNSSSETIHVLNAIEDEWAVQHEDEYHANFESMDANEDQQAVQYEKEYDTTNPANMVASEIFKVSSYQVMPQHHDLNHPITWGSSEVENLVELPAQFDQSTFRDQQGNMADLGSVQQILEAAPDYNSEASASAVAGPKGLKEAEIKKWYGKRLVDAARELKVHPSTVKRFCHKCGISKCPGALCNSRKRSRNNKIDDSYTLIVKAKYDGVLVRFKIDSNKIEFQELCYMLRDRFCLLESLSFVIEYEDANIELAPIMISDTKDLRARLDFLKASNYNTMELLIVSSGNY